MITKNELIGLIPQINEVIKNEGELKIINNSFDIRKNTVKRHDGTLEYNSLFDRHGSKCVNIYFNRVWYDEQAVFSLSVSSTTVNDLEDAQNTYIKPMARCARILEKLEAIDSRLVE